MLSGALCLLCGVAIGCVEAPGSASPDQIAPLKARLAAQPNPPPFEYEPNQRRPDGEGFFIHVAGELRCEGLLSVEQVVYAETHVTSPGRDGLPATLRDINVAISVQDGLFKGLTERGPPTVAQRASGSLVLEGNLLTNPCGCVKVVGNARLPSGAEIRARKTLCPEGQTAPASGS